MRAGRKGACRTKYFDDRPVMKPDNSSGSVEVGSEKSDDRARSHLVHGSRCISEVNYNSLIRESLRKKMR